MLNGKTYLDALNEGDAIGGFFDDIVDDLGLGSDPSDPSDPADPNGFTPAPSDSGGGGDIAPYYPSRSDRNASADPQFAADADLLYAIGYGNGGASAYSGRSDPDFIASTEAFQSDAHLTVDGDFGPATRAAAQATYARMQAGGGLGPAPGGGDAPAPGGGSSPSLPLANVVDSVPPWLLYGGLAVGALVVGGILLTGGKKKKKGKRAR